MQQFNDQKGERRLLSIANMQVKDAESYYRQYNGLEKMERLQKIKNLKERIKKNKKNPKLYEWILAIKSKDKNVVGKIEVLSKGNGIAFLTISIPKEDWLYKYGIEAIDQFIKICKENEYFSTIELDEDNWIVERYREIYDSDLIINL